MSTKFRQIAHVSAQAIPLRAFIAHYKMFEEAGLRDHLEKRAPFSTVPFVILAAFSIEAYVNSLGFRKVKSWKSRERTGWKAKIDLLHKLAKRVPNWDENPLKFAVEVFATRDRLAHGKPEIVKSKRILDVPEPLNDSSEQLWPVWLEKIDLAWAASSRYEIEKLLTYLGALFDYEKKDHLLVSDGDYEAVEV
jgi:hypothetical protein